MGQGSGWPGQLVVRVREAHRRQLSHFNLSNEQVHEERGERRTSFSLAGGRAESKDLHGKAGAHGVKVSLNSKEGGEPAIGDRVLLCL